LTRCLGMPALDAGLLRNPTARPLLLAACDRSGVDEDAGSGERLFA